LPVSEDDPLADRVAGLLEKSGMKIAVLETSAGGTISARLLSRAGASAWFDRGLIAYSRPAKQSLMGDGLEALERHGVVSAEAASGLAEALRREAKVDVALAESGIAGPQTGRRSSKPAGTSFVAVALSGGTVVEERLLSGTRTEIMQQIAEQALTFLISTLEHADS